MIALTWRTCKHPSLKVTQICDVSNLLSALKIEIFHWKRISFWKLLAEHWICKHSKRSGRKKHRRRAFYFFYQYSHWVGFFLDRFNLKWDSINIEFKVKGRSTNQKVFFYSINNFSDKVFYSFNLCVLLRRRSERERKNATTYARRSEKWERMNEKKAGDEPIKFKNFAAIVWLFDSFLHLRIILKLFPSPFFPCECQKNAMKNL